jgi:tetratricopeptide (TPR) repeat protein
MISLALEYAWHGDAESELSWLESAASMPASIDTGRAAVLLAEAVLFTGDRTTATQLLDGVRLQHTDPEIIAFADLVSGLVPLTPRQTSHGRRLYADYEVMRGLCADAADRWRGTFVGGWSLIRLGHVYRAGLDRADDAVAVLGSNADYYAGSVFREWALEDLAAAVTFSLGDFAQGRQLYQELLATTGDDFIRQRATLHLGELLMDLQQYDEAYGYFDEFVRRWPEHADSVGAVILRGYVASRIHKWDEAVADANRYLSLTASTLPDYAGKAHLALARAAYARGDLDAAEAEFALVNDEYLTPEGKAGVGRCRARRGDLQGAMSAFLEAAALASPLTAPSHYYQAARLAQMLGDRNTFNQILARLIAEFPGSSFTALLAGRDILPPADI